MSPERATGFIINQNNKSVLTLLCQSLSIQKGCQCYSSLNLLLGEFQIFLLLSGFKEFQHFYI